MEEQGCSGQSGLVSHPSSSPVATGASAPAAAHVVIVVEENHSYGQIIGSRDAPYLNSLAASGALMTSSYAVAHPSEPNYLALFAGSTFGLESDACPVRQGNAANLGAELLASGRTFTGYAEGLRRPGSMVCSAGNYARKHAPWTDFGNVPAQDSQPLTAFPTDYTALPTVSFVIPDLQHDMHDGTVAQGDTWLKDHLSRYATWAAGHNSLLIITWDEDDHSTDNHIPTIFVGQRIKPGKYPEAIDHVTILRTLQAMYDLPPTADTTPIRDIWS